MREGKTSDGVGCSEVILRGLAVDVLAGIDLHFPRNLLLFFESSLAEVIA
jgi:hypothetical protein